MAKDSLGNEIVIGNYYGYSKMSNGWVNIVIGKAVKVTEPSNEFSYSDGTRVTLSDVVEQSGVYGNPDSTTKGNKNRSVYSRTVFPVNITEVNKEILDNTK